MKIQSTDTVTETKIKCLISGLSGSGKTSQAKTLKKSGFNPLIISNEGGLLPLSGHGIDYVDISRDEAGALIPKAKRVGRLMEVYKFLLTDEAKEKYNLVYIDSLTEISQVLFDNVLEQFPERKDSLVLYGQLGHKTRDVLKAFRDLPHYHVVMTCLTTVDKDDNGKRFVAFDLIGGTRDKLAQYFDLVMHLRVSHDGVREFICGSTDSIVAKDRSSKLSPVEPADLGAIFNKMLPSTGTQQPSVGTQQPPPGTQQSKETQNV